MFSILNYQQYSAIPFQLQGTVKPPLAQNVQLQAIVSLNKKSSNGFDRLSQKVRTVHTVA